jgi:acyl-CoA thioesterase
VLLNVRISVGEFVGLVAGLADRVGVGGALAANALQAAQPPTVRTASAVTSLTSLGLRVVLFESVPVM